MMEAGATYMVCRNIPFQHMFMNIAIIGFARCGVGTTAAGALVERMLAWAMNKNVMLTSSEIDYANLEKSWFTEYFTQQNIMLAVKECFGYLALLGILMMLTILFARFSPSMNRILPTMSAAARWIRNPHGTSIRH